MTSFQTLLDHPFPALPLLVAAPLGAHAVATLKRAQSHAQDLQARVADTVKETAEGLTSPAAFFAPLDAAPAEEAATRFSDLFATRFIAVAHYQAAAGAAALDLAHYWLFGETAPGAVKPAEAPAATPAPLVAPEADPAAQSAAAAEAAPAAADEPTAPALFAEPPAQTDNLLAIKGVGPKINGFLNSLGVYTYAQIAEWSPAEVAWIEDKLEFRGRVTREGWQAQAAALLAEAGAAA